MSIAAGMEHGNLFAAVRNGKYPDPTYPALTDIEEQEEFSRKACDDMPGTTPEEVEKKAAELAAIDLYYNALTQSQKTRLNIMYQKRYEAELKTLEDEKREINQNKSKLFWTIMGCISNESLDRVKSLLLEKWEALELSQDPLTLYKALKETHTAFGSGADPTDAARTRNRYYALKQFEKESLSTFKDRHDTMIRAFKALGIDVPSEEEQAADLLSKVNGHYAPAASKIEDSYKITKLFPKTTFEAFRLLTELTADKQVFSNVQ
jgi:hypothetical protein